VHFLQRFGMRQSVVFCTKATTPAVKL